MIVEDDNYRLSVDGDWRRDTIEKRMRKIASANFCYAREIGLVPHG